VYRFLVRGGPNTEANIRRMLDTIDSAEKGYPDLETYEEELKSQAEVLGAGNRAAAEVEASPEPDPRDAEIASLRAQIQKLYGPKGQAVTTVPTEGRLP
jgi:hypothetical protein